MLSSVVTHVLDLLKDHGINAASDARNLTLPGVWVTLDRVAFDVLDATTADIAVTLVAVAADHGTGRALDELGTISATLAPDVPTWTAASIRLPNHAPDPLPCLTATINLTWTADE